MLLSLDRAIFVLFHAPPMSLKGSNPFLEPVSEEVIRTLLQKRTFGDFTFTDAVRPQDESFLTQEGYEVHSLDTSNAPERIVIAAVSRQKLFDVFTELLEPLGELLDVVLETEDEEDESVFEAHSYGTDRLYLQSVLPDFEDVLLNCGNTKIGVVSTERPKRVELDFHKLLLLYGKKIRPFLQILVENNIPQLIDMHTIDDVDQYRISDTEFPDQIQRMMNELGMEEGRYER